MTLRPIKTYQEFMGRVYSYPDPLHESVVRFTVPAMRVFLDTKLGEGLDGMVGSYDYDYETDEPCNFRFIERSK